MFMNFFGPGSTFGSACDFTNGGELGHTTTITFRHHCLSDSVLGIPQLKRPYATIAFLTAMLTVLTCVANNNYT